MNNRSFLPLPVLLNQAANDELGNGSGITRRTFVKRTGGATVATMVVWNTTIQMARASGTGSDSSASWEGETGATLD